MPKLTIVGLGIRPEDHLTVEAAEQLRIADEVFYLVGDPFAEAAVLEIVPDAVNLYRHYTNSSARRTFYYEIAREVAAAVARSQRVCFAVYGHPTLGVDPVQEAVRLVRMQGAPVTVLPGISSLDCLLADLGLDPMIAGIQGYEATKFLHTRPNFDSRVPLILFQIGTVGNLGWPVGVDQSAMSELVALLGRKYGWEHCAAVYEAAIDPFGRSRRTELVLGQLTLTELTPLSTLIVPPQAGPERS
jgi:CheY-like chemotaxis protein